MEWVSVREVLPELRKHVLVALITKFSNAPWSAQITVAFLSQKDPCIWDTGDCCGLLNVEFWMPLDELLSTIPSLQDVAERIRVEILSNKEKEIRHQIKMLKNDIIELWK